jgi:hydrogenase maturation protease
MSLASPTLLVIGYGNDLCGDDAAGPRMADAVAAWRLPHVRALALHQLTPDLAAPLSEADLAIFVDAGLPSEVSELQIRPVAPSGPSRLGHTSDPGTLLGLAAALYGRAPEAYLLVVPGLAFAFGDPLSPRTERAMDAALIWLRDTLTHRPASAALPAISQSQEIDRAMLSG